MYIYKKTNKFIIISRVNLQKLSKRKKTIEFDCFWQKDNFGYQFRLILRYFIGKLRFDSTKAMKEELEALIFLPVIFFDILSLLLNKHLLKWN
jgi:hypothetical protein